MELLRLELAEAKADLEDERQAHQVTIQKFSDLKRLLESKSTETVQLKLSIMQLKDQLAAPQKHYENTVATNLIE